MKNFLLRSILLVVAGSTTSTAHTAFTNFYIGNQNQGNGVAVRMSSNPANSTSPIPSVTSSDIACGYNGETGVNLIASTKAGATITFEFRDHPDGSQSGSIDPSHKGPCAVYMKKVNDSSANNTASGDGWFKIMEQTYDNKTNKWCTENLIANNGHLAAIIPPDIAPGYYLMRPELLALHAAAAKPPDPQFYVGCAQIFLSSGGNAQPGNTTSIPGYVELQTPGMTYNIYEKPLKLPYPNFGPPVYIPGPKPSHVQKMTQTIGLKPPNCVMQNANWCSYMPPTYNNNLTGCWTALQNCSTQTSDCYSSAPPSGNQNCKDWENYCKHIQDNCNMKTDHGPPSPDQYKPAPLPYLSGGAATAPLPKADKTNSSSSSLVSLAPNTSTIVSVSVVTVSIMLFNPTVVASPVPGGAGAVVAGSAPTSTMDDDGCD